VHPSIALTLDAVIFAHKEKELQVLLIQRKNDPFKGYWALPGGFLEENETLESGCRRELQEETGLRLDAELFRTGIYDALNRDPRGRTITVAYSTLLDRPQKVAGNDDASIARWLMVNKLDGLAFDHELIIRDALQRLKLLKYMD